MPRSRSQSKRRDGRTEVVQVVGNVGHDPEQREDHHPVSFSIAQTLAYGDPDDKRDDGETRWVRVAVWKEPLQDYVFENIFKGTRVVVEGALEEDEYKGETQYQLTAFRVGLVDWAPPAGSKSRRSRRDEDEDEEDDL